MSCAGCWCKHRCVFCKWTRRDPDSVCVCVCFHFFCFSFFFIVRANGNVIGPETRHHITILNGLQHRRTHKHTRLHDTHTGTHVSTITHVSTLDARCSIHFGLFLFSFRSFRVVFVFPFFVSIRMHKSTIKNISHQRCAYVIARNVPAHDAHCVCSLFCPTMRFLGSSSAILSSFRGKGYTLNRFHRIYLIVFA